MRHGRGTRRFARLWQSPRTTRLSAPHRYVGSLSRFVCLGRAPAARALFVAARTSARMRRSTATARVAFARSFSSQSYRLHARVCADVGSLACQQHAATFRLGLAPSRPPSTRGASRAHPEMAVPSGSPTAALGHRRTHPRTHAHTPSHSPTPVFARAGRAPSEGPRNRRNATVCSCIVCCCCWCDV